jgi:hypothetical protein
VRRLGDRDEVGELAELHRSYRIVIVKSPNVSWTYRGRARKLCRMLPDFPRRTVAVLATVDPAPHAIPVSAPVRASETRVLLSLHRSRDSLARLKRTPDVALTILAEGDVAFTARGRATVIEEPMATDEDYAAVAIEVEHVDDHRQPSFAVTGGVDREWTDPSEQKRLGARVSALGAR